MKPDSNNNNDISRKEAPLLRKEPYILNLYMRIVNRCQAGSRFMRWAALSQSGSNSTRFFFKNYLGWICQALYLLKERGARGIIAGTQAPENNAKETAHQAAEPETPFPFAKHGRWTILETRLSLLGPHTIYQTLLLLNVSTVLAVRPELLNGGFRKLEVPFWVSP